MLVKDCVLKYGKNDVWLYHTTGSYRVRMNAESVEVLNSMVRRHSPEEMTRDEILFYTKLSARGLIGPDTGCERDRLIPVKRKSPVETFELEFSGRCNLRCAHCFATLSQKDMERETLNAVFEGIDALEPVRLVLNGGEPLLNPLLPETLNRARERNMRINVMSNGLLANEETADLLKSYGTAKVLVSLDFFEEIHDAIRGEGSFRKAVKGIKTLLSKKVPVYVTAMVQDNTVDRLKDFENFCLNELGVSGIRFSSIVPIGRAKNAFQGLRLSAAKTRDLFGKGVIRDGDETEDILNRATGDRSFHCTAGQGQCFISAEGKMYGCRFFQNIGEEMGDLSVKSLEQIYREYPLSGAITFNFEWNRLEKCTTCAHFVRCAGGCRVRAKIIAGDWYKPDPYSCEMYGAEN